MAESSGIGQEQSIENRQARPARPAVVSGFEAATSAFWMDGASDLAGNPRVDHRQKVDIGCYEAMYVAPETLLLIR